jgi:indolepyruvate ferredoxin oxidoreductase
MTTPLRTDYRLADSLEASQGHVFLTGTQALIRLLLMQRLRDHKRGLRTHGFLCGYRGSPLGMVDQAAWSHKKLLDEHGIQFLPAINEELAATAVLGTQRVESDPQRTVDGVFSMWYGKGPGVDRAGDALKHGNAYGSSRAGGVLVVAGDDHGCVSSSMPHQSDQAFQAWRMPTVSPGTVAEYVEFGLYGWELSRFSGNWVGFTALSEVVESGSTVDLDASARCVDAWKSREEVAQLTGYVAPAGGLNYRWPDLPSLSIEERLHRKLEAVRVFSRINSIDRQIVQARNASVGIITCGKAHFDLLEVLRRIGVSLDDLEAAGVRLYKVGLSYPLEPTRIADFVRGLKEVLVVEEKGDVVESQLKEMLFNAATRPNIVGKRDAMGAPLISDLGELRPSRLIGPVAVWLAAHAPPLNRTSCVADFTPAALPSNAADSVKRVPYFCAGCPHNTSTVVPEGSHAQAGIGCHFMASWMNRETNGLIQMGGEGVDWVAHSRFTKVPHVFQNLGDGTYYHSGYLAIRQAIAAKTNITFKILFNDAVAMTGGQPVDGVLTVDGMARQVAAEGVRKVVVVSDSIEKYGALKHKFPEGTEFHDRAHLDDVQRHLRTVPGVTVLIYEQTCAAEKRRRRKKNELVDPPIRMFINEDVCEGCGDCSVQSNCVAVLPMATPLGRKRTIDQSACNKDLSCAKGFCPSFVGILGGRPKRHTGALSGAETERMKSMLDALPLPSPHDWEGPYDLLVTGVGGTGVVTVGAIIAMAAHLEGKAASVLDFMGFAQKGGSVLSFVRLAQHASALNQVRIDAQQADAVLACDMVVAASAEALQTFRSGRTRVVANLHEVPVAASVRDPDADLSIDLLLEKLQIAAGRDRVETLDAQSIAQEFLGDTIYSNVLAMGFAWQIGLLPLTLPAMLHAIDLNGVAVENNKLAFFIGRLHAAEPDFCRQLLQKPAMEGGGADTLDAFIQRAVRHLTDYQNPGYAARFTRLVEMVRSRELAVAGSATALPLTFAVARSMLKLMAYKDEYEVARLYTNGDFEKKLRQQFEGNFSLEFHMAPPALTSSKDGRPPRKMRLGAWMFPLLKVLAKGKHLRGTALDPFGYASERRLERQLIDQYEKRIHELCADLSPQKLPLGIDIASVPLSIRGYGHVKLANLAMARAREAELLQRFDSARYPLPNRSTVAGQFRGIPVVKAKKSEMA